MNYTKYFACPRKLQKFLPSIILTKMLFLEMYHKLSIQKIFKTFLLKIVVLWTSKNCSQDKILDFFKTLKDNLEDFLVVNGKKRHFMPEQQSSSSVFIFGWNWMWCSGDWLLGIHWRSLGMQPACTIQPSKKIQRCRWKAAVSAIEKLHQNVVSNKSV